MTRYLLPSVPQLIGNSIEEVQALREAVTARARSRVSWMLASAPVAELRFLSTRKGHVRVVYQLDGQREIGTYSAPPDDAFPLRRSVCGRDAIPAAPQAGEVFRRATRVVHVGSVANAAHFGAGIPWLRPGPIAMSAAYRVRVGAQLLRADDGGAWRAVCAAIVRHGGSLAIRARRVALSTPDAAMLRTTLDYLDGSLGKSSELSPEDPRRTVRELVERGDAWQVSVMLSSPNADALLSAVCADLGDVLERDGAALEPGELASEHSRLWGRTEVIDLLSPPWTVAAPLAGLRHHVPLVIPRGMPRRDRGAAHHIVIGTAKDDAMVTRVASLQTDHLTRHALVFGATGTGKTNTTVHLLSQLRASGIPFLVVDPIKSDYSREAMRRGWSDVGVFDLSPDRTPRFNPFIPPPGVGASEYAGVLAAALVLPFTTTHVAYEYMRKLVLDTYSDWARREARSLGNPVPRSILEIDRQALLEATIAPPTFENFLNDSPRFLEALSPAERRTRWMVETLEFFTRRFELMRTSMMARVFSPSDPATTIDALFENPTIIELGRILESSEANALAGVIVGLLTTHRRSQAADGAGLRHVLVLEEAHRLMPRTTDKSGDPEVRASAGAQLADMLSDFIKESRAWGQAVVMVEQRPSGLRSDAIANAATVIAHGLYDFDDRVQAVTALGLRELHEHVLLSLDVGQAWVRLPGEHLPVRVRVPLAKGLAGEA
ncbi:MAG: ATP-binding protein [Gemmatimonadetes bacterium]|nr:ATP-binding protein [Gemmatimonadota bacterium]